MPYKKLTNKEKIKESNDTLNEVKDQLNILIKEMKFTRPHLQHSLNLIDVQIKRNKQ